MENQFFFELYHNELKIFKSPSSTPPSQGEFVYSPVLLNHFGNEHTIKATNFNGLEERQIIHIKNSLNAKFIIKRTSIDCSIIGSNDEEEDKNLLQSPKVIKFLNEGLKEYYISRLISSHPAGVSTFGFAITKLVTKNPKTLVFEILMEDVGINLKNMHLNSLSPKFNGLYYFREIINIMKYIESLRIAHCDVKLSNFIIDSQGHVRIIDYDISQKAGDYSITTRKGVTKVLGFTRSYVSPEVKVLYEKQKNDPKDSGEEIDPWKADVYSTGILGLQLFGGLKEDSDTWKSLDEYKKDVGHHLKITNLIKDIRCETPELTEKVKFLIEICLQFDPSSRLNFRDLSQILDLIIKDVKEDIMNIKSKAYELLKISKQSRSQLLKKITELEVNLDVEKLKNNSLVKILSSIKNEKSDLRRNLDEINPLISNNKTIIQNLKEENLKLELFIKELSNSNSIINNDLKKNQENYEEALKKADNELKTKNGEIKKLQQELLIYKKEHPNFKPSPDNILQPFVPANLNLDCYSYLYYLTINEGKKLELHLKDVQNINHKEYITLYDADKGCFIDSAIYKGYVFCCGGMRNKSFLDTCAKINLENKTIDYSSKLTESKDGVALISTIKGLFCIGGTRDFCLPTCEYFDEAKNCWIKGPSLNQADCHVTLGFFYPNIIYCLGGQCHEFIEMLDISNLNNKWERTTKISIFSEREYGCAINISNNSMLIFGGLNAVESFTIFDTTSESYKSLDENFLLEETNFCGTKPLRFDNELIFVIPYKENRIREFHLNIQKRVFTVTNCDF